MDIKTSSKCWGYSKKPKNWKKYFEEDGYDLYDLIAKQSPTKSIELTQEEIKKLGLSIEQKFWKAVSQSETNPQPKSKLKSPTPDADKPLHDADKPLHDSSISYT